MHGPAQCVCCGPRCMHAWIAERNTGAFRSQRARCAWLTLVRGHDGAWLIMTESGIMCRMLALYKANTALHLVLLLVGGWLAVACSAGRQLLLELRDLLQERVDAAQGRARHRTATHSHTQPHIYRDTSYTELQERAAVWNRDRSRRHSPVHDDPAGEGEQRDPHVSLCAPLLREGQRVSVVPGVPHVATCLARVVHSAWEAMHA